MVSNTRDSNEYVNLSNKSIDDIARRVIYEQNRMDEDKDNTYGMMIYCALFLIHIIDLFWLVYFCTFLVTVYTIGGSSIIRYYFVIAAILIATIWLYILLALSRLTIIKPNKKVKKIKVPKWSAAFLALYSFIGVAFYSILVISKTVFHTVLLEEYVGSAPERILGLISFQLAGVMVMLVVFMITKAVKNWGKTWRFNILSLILASFSCILGVIGIVCSFKL